ncbi:MAG: type VI secretion system tip protein VgrG [Tyzzerella sp.]|nr:type VI secretion system tip protein VgrG [Tyzzerella sp.]
MNKDDFYNKARFGEITGIGGLSETHAFNDDQYSMNNEIDNLSPQEYLLEKDAQKLYKKNKTSINGGGEEDSCKSSFNVEDFSADMISEINVVLNGTSSSLNSSCTINGKTYRLSSYTLSQELLQPMILCFSLEKEDKTETDSDVVFNDTSNIIGKALEIHVSTIKTSLNEEDSSSQKAFVFKGMIIDVTASRATASTQSASVTVATWDALLQNAPHCRSFENMTLKDIIESVLKPYSDIKSKISPRFKDKIPYIVQYNQSDYAFISMLAVRFGEWMYNTGETFIFGEIEDSGSSANLEYPGGSLMSYNLHQSMTSFSFNHLLPDYYQYGKEKAILKESAQGIADGTVNNWTDKAFNASMQRFKNEQIATLNAGGFDSGKEDEGSDSILDYSLKIEAQGKKTGIMTVHGFSKLAMLKIGQTFLIRDNVQNKSGESKDVEQKALKVIGINHSFDYRQEYSNSFAAVPVACNYPSYSDADVFPSAPQQRAKVVENKDEQKLGRIRVQFPWQEIQSKDMKTPWLRIAVPYAGASKGHQFIPEIGEEVMVGFEMDNAEKPYIIGALYNGGKGKPDEEWAASKDDDGTNTVKAIRTRNGHTIEIHDKGNDGYIRIYDNKKENYILTFSTDEKLIKLESTGNIELYAKNDIIMQAGHDIRVQAGHDRNTSVGRNDSLSVGSNQFVKIGANKDEQVANHLQISAQNIRVEAGMSLNEYSTTHNINALAEVSITSTGPTNIKSKILKAN